MVKLRGVVVYLCFFSAVLISCSESTQEPRTDHKKGASIETVDGGDDSVLIADPSFEQTRVDGEHGVVFERWRGWRNTRGAEFRVSPIAHSGKSSCLLYNPEASKIRVYRAHKRLKPARYRVTAFLRGLGIESLTESDGVEFAFGDQRMILNKVGTFGWTKLAYVTDVKAAKPLNAPSFGLLAKGYLWIDDVEMTAVDLDVPVTEQPVLSPSASFTTPPKDGETWTRCSMCNYRNPPSTEPCAACGEPPAKVPPSELKPIRRLDSFEDVSLKGYIKALIDKDETRTTEQHATHGQKSLRLESGGISLTKSMNWIGYDYLMVDLYVDGPVARRLKVEIHDIETEDHASRGNMETVAEPGKSTLRIALNQLYTGDKAAPGRQLLLGAIEKLVFRIDDQIGASIYFDNIRLETDSTVSAKAFDGLYAFDFGTPTSPLMPGFIRISPSSHYDEGIGFGLKDTEIWRAEDAFQPDPLYQDFICIENGGLAVDLPNGRYHVFVNMDSPSGYWGEYQVYDKRAIVAEGKPVIEDKMSFDSMKNKYLSFWDVDDTPDDDTFEKYQQTYYVEKEFDVEVTDGMLNIDFEGHNWACSVSTIVIYPTDEAAAGKAFLEHVVAKRRQFFNDSFKRILRSPNNSDFAANDQERERGYVSFVRDYMDDVHFNDIPQRPEVAATAVASGFAGEIEPVAFSIYPLKDLGAVSVSVSDLKGPSRIPSDTISVGYVSYRLSRVTTSGSVYTIEPRLVIPKSSVEIKAGLTRRFWLTIQVPKTAKPGAYNGRITIRPTDAPALSLPLTVNVFNGRLDPVDIPVGPWGYALNLPWLSDDRQTIRWNRIMARKSLTKLNETGFTSFSGVPVLRYEGFEDRVPKFDFEFADQQMWMARDAGFTMPLMTYAKIKGLDLYKPDLGAMTEAGYDDYGKFIKAVFTRIQSHARSTRWLPLYWNIGDEPHGEQLQVATKNAAYYKTAFPAEPPLFTAATSYTGGADEADYLAFAKNLHVVNLFEHSERGVAALKAEGVDWAFYNDGNRWTYGVYMYKAAKQHGMKFRYNWHWNMPAGDPYYALDCRADDYAWANVSPDGRLVMSLEFEREMREGIDDYRYLLTLVRLAKERNDAAAKGIVDKRLAEFRLGQTDFYSEKSGQDWRALRKEWAAAIERLLAAKSSGD